MPRLTGLLGPLEHQIMNVVWESDKCSVREIGQAAA